MQMGGKEMQLIKDFVSMQWQTEHFWHDKLVWLTGSSAQWHFGLHEFLRPEK